MTTLPPKPGSRPAPALGSTPAEKKLTAGQSFGRVIGFAAAAVIILVIIFVAANTSAAMCNWLGWSPFAQCVAAQPASSINGKLPGLQR